MKLTIRHRFDFEQRLPAGLDSPDTWDTLRSRVDAFGLPASRDAWEAAAAASGLEPRAEAIARIVRALGSRTICSYGVGAGLLEWNLHRLAPELRLTCTDFAPVSVARLRAHFEGVRVVRHDFRTDPPLQSDLHLLHRVDTELSEAEWAGVFARFHEPVLVVATELVGLRALAREFVTRALHPRAEAAGWIRNEAALRALWDRSHDDHRVEVADLTGYLLTSRPR